ncbi:MAG: UDP-3-O-(3-hydroxymyristoyl)glucosamine N-acyltransferase, partial [Leptonema sp. (in: Bacteria)]|nr:UDP-3-O-(3-hydroxymyristoyl)glucosamine N-acyltransferase [Leptonema sp. (in: bacteria)]
MKTKLEQPVSLTDIAEFLQSKGLKIEQPKTEAQISGINSIDCCEDGDLTFASSPEYLLLAVKTKAAAIVTDSKAISKTESPLHKPLLIVNNVNLAHALLKQNYTDWPFRNTEEWGQIHESAVIHKTAKIDSTAIIGPNSVIGRNAEIGANSVVMAGTVVESEAIIGQNTILHPNVTIGRQCQIGNDCIIRSGTVIGSEGFGFAQDSNRKHHRIPQTGIVIIEDKCVIGANNCVDRAAYGITRIRSGIITDNFCHVAHNCDIGDDSILVAFTGIAGSTTLGKRVICSGQTGILDHINIPDDTTLLLRAAVTESIEKAGVYAAGPPLVPLNTHLRNSVLMRSLP